MLEGASMKTVAVLGGSFDPPTNAHMMVARSVLSDRDLGVHEVWIMPCFDHPFGKKTTDFDDRMEMCAIAVRGSNPDGKMVVSDYERVISERWSCWDPSSTMKTAFKLAEDYDGVSFRFVIGLDCALDFEKWKHSEDLRSFASFIVVPRAGYEHVTGAWYARAPHVYMDWVDAYDMSSTKARESLCLWKDRTQDPPVPLEIWLDRDVLKYISSRGLYMASSSK